MWDNVEVVRGANALLTGAGNPSGTINYHRRTAISGVLDGEFTPNLHLSASYMRQDGKSTGVMWGALPLQDSAGNQLEYSRNASTTMDWIYWNTHDQTAYGQLTWDFAPGWSVRAHVTRKHHAEEAQLFYVRGTPTRDAETGTWSGLTVGVQRTVGTYLYYGRPVPDSDPAWGAIAGLPETWTGSEVALPAFGALTEQEHTEDRQWRLRGASDVALTDRLSVLPGASYLVEKTRGESYGVSTDKNEKALSPFIGATFKALPGVNLYASYSSIFAPQANLDMDRRPLGAAKGKSYEAGGKAQTPGSGLFGSVAWFRAEQSNLADAGAYDSATGQTLYIGIRAGSRGVEAEVSGKLTSTLTIQAGATTLKMDDGAGTIRQGDYATLQLQAGYKLNENVQFNLNVANVTNHSYLTSLYWTQAYYAAPRNVTGSVRVTF